MSDLIENALIDLYRNGTKISTGRVVQIDDDGAEKESIYNGVPVLTKKMYDQPKSIYKRGDRVIITALDGHGAVLPEDYIFWVLRASEAGNPLPATKVGLVGGLVTNVTITIKRGTTVISDTARAYFQVPGPERFSTSGMVLMGTLYFPDTTTPIKRRDVITLTFEDDQTTLDAQTNYQVRAVLHSPAPVPFLRVDLYSADT